MGRNRLVATVWLCLIFLILMPIQFVKAQDANARLEEKRRAMNDISVSIVVSGLSCTCARFAEDIRNVVNDLKPDGVRVLPVLGVGGLQNIDDVLLLKSIDMGVVDEDNVRLLKKKDPQLYANLERRINFITKLYNSEFQVLARSDIRSYDDLVGKKVNFNLKDSQTEVSANVVFDELKLNVQKTYYDNDEAIKALREGTISAMIILTGAPQAALAKLTQEDHLHFLELSQESLPNHNLSGIFTNYLPAELTHEQYPNLIAEGSTVHTFANRALLVAYAWPENSPRYRKIAHFIDQFFSKIDQFHSAARHPKWKEISLSAEIPGWTRFKAASDWLAAHQKSIAAPKNPLAPSPTPDAGQRPAERAKPAVGPNLVLTGDQEKLYKEFLDYIATQPAQQRPAR
jgi:TRAP-type uncharacterized transport system substrate-binding protein